MKIKYNENIIFKVSSELKEALEERAYQNGQNVSEYIRGLIIRDVKEKR